eukprot:TRINITY_DN20936_c0_g1_i1.p2 TRINITY_DN20936_c0_g1~~TRINITY_DN20936_c0_g1_i1.p2  ORF type:complete len:152 (-),score=45.69 TRINITY_DN20936_c0_g1_i1:35-490(-)
MLIVFFFQAEDGIRDHAQSRGLGDVYKRQQQRRVHGKYDDGKRKREKKKKKRRTEELKKENGQKRQIKNQEEKKGKRKQFGRGGRGGQVEEERKKRKEKPRSTYERGKDKNCLLYTSDAADDMQCVDLGGRRIIKKKKKNYKLSILKGRRN